MTGFDPSALLPLVEPLAVLTGIACVALTVRQRISNWPIGIVSSALFLVLFLAAGPVRGLAAPGASTSGSASTAGGTG